MLKRPKPIEINPDFIGDKLERKQTIINLTEIVKNSEEGFVLSVNAPWGSGKTTFINFWKAYLEKEGFKTIYFNAWESDFSKEPLLVLLSKITSELKPTNIDKVDKVKKVGIKIGIAALAIGVRAATAGVLKLEDFSGEETDRAIADVASKLVEDKLNSLTAEASLQEQFRNALEDLATEAIADTERSKLVFFIDELDRCRPTYAVELLEAVKHFFSVDNIVFVLSMDKKQLGCSISTMYGSGMDTEAYLKRFIDLNYDLQMPSNEKFIEYLFEYYGFNSFFSQIKLENDYDAKPLVALKYFCEQFEFKPRDIEHIFIQLTTIFLTDNKKHISYYVFIIFLITLRAKDRNYYLRIMKKEMLNGDVFKLLDNIEAHSQLYCLIDAYMRYGADENNSFIDWLSQLSDETFKNPYMYGKPDETRLSRHFGNKVCEQFRDSKTFLKQINDKIEFLENIDWSKR